VVLERNIERRVDWEDGLMIEDNERCNLQAALQALVGTRSSQDLEC
jgi:hypothetical protein